MSASLQTGQGMANKKQDENRSLLLVKLLPQVEPDEWLNAHLEYAVGSTVTSATNLRYGMPRQNT